MRNPLFIAAILALGASTALAGRNQNGAMILHTNDAYEYSTDTACVTAQGDPGACEEANTMATRGTGQVVWLLAAFLPTADPCVVVVYFGIDYDDGNLDPVAHRFCGPDGSLEIPDEDWPHAGRGNSVAFGTPVCHDTLFPFYVFRIDGGVDGASFFCSTINPTGGYGAFVDDGSPPILDPCYNYGCVRWGEPGQNDCPGVLPSVGACCFANGSCRFIPPDECESSGGIYLGDDVLCSPNPCPQPGACCFPDGHCELVLPADCDGAFHGGPCVPNPCPQPPPFGACCYADGHCEYLLEAECQTESWLPNASCEPNPCPQLGACCFPDGRCEYVLASSCHTGTFYPDTPCEPNPCPQPIYGSCCYPDGHCEYTVQAACGTGAFYPEFVCEPNPCPQPAYGACCFLDGHCEYLMQPSCDAGIFLPDIPCDPNPCSPMGACCFADGRCDLVIEGDCATGVYYPHVPCDPNPCPGALGACCYEDHHCEHVPQSSCHTGEFYPDTPCDPTPCGGCRSSGVFLPIPPEAARGGRTEQPVAYSPRSGGARMVPATRDVCWSEPADLNDSKISSEVIGMFGLESRIANDFLLDTDATITKAIAYGGMYNWAGEPNMTAFNLLWYVDGGCCPDQVIDSYLGVTPDQTFIGYDGFGFPTYRLECPVNVGIYGGSRYWFMLQAADHPFPPQWGRQGTGGIVTACDSMFWCAYFGCPNWTPAGDLVGAPYDAAQEFECGGATPTKRVSWGAIRALFRDPIR